MLKKFTAIQEENWFLVFVASVIFLGGAVLLGLAIVYWAQLGLWAFLVGVSGLTSMYFAWKAVRTNEPAWILLDLILPG